MWMVTVVQRHRGAGDSIDYKELFDSKEDALEFANAQKEDKNCGVWLRKFVQLEDGDWAEDKVTCLQEIEYY